MHRLLVFLLLFTAFAAAAADNAFDEADGLSMGRDLRRARDLFRSAARSDADPMRRHESLIRAGRLDWYAFHDARSARSELAAVPDSSGEASFAHAERSRLEADFAHDFKTARRESDAAYALARSGRDRDQALTLGAAATVEEARLARLAGQCPQDREQLQKAVADLSTAIRGSGPSIARSRLLLDAALFVRDLPTALRAWGWYYADVPALVPGKLTDRRGLGLALAAARLFAEAELVLRDPCAEDPVPFDDAVHDILVYAASTRRVAALAADYHRAVANGTSDRVAFQRALAAEAVGLWSALSWAGPPPPFSAQTVPAELGRRFGAVIALGETDGIFNLLYGHRIRDETRAIEQYGHSASVRFVQLDGMVAGGYAAWATRGERGTGAWSDGDAIDQVRPLYADIPIRAWNDLMDPELHKRGSEQIRVETERDAARARGHAIRAFLGLELRFRREYAERLRDRLVGDGLSGDALRDAFLRQVSADKLASSIWAHEGRHAIDKSLGIRPSGELEFRAKLSEVAFAPDPRIAFGAILTPVGGPSTHGIANAQVLEGVEAWMREHAAGLAALDRSAPLLPQLDRLSDGELRAAFRSLDPLAAGRAGSVAVSANDWSFVTTAYDEPTRPYLDA
jgi:hypothetical protein